MNTSYTRLAVFPCPSSRRNHLESSLGASRSGNIRPRATGHVEISIAKESVGASADIEQEFSGGLVGTALEGDILLPTVDGIVKLRLEYNSHLDGGAIAHGEGVASAHGGGVDVPDCMIPACHEVDVAARVDVK